MNDLENQLELLKKMGAPSGGSSDGLLDVLNDITDKLRNELNDKLDALAEDLKKRIEQVDNDSKERDNTQEERMKSMVDIQNDNIKRLDALELQTAGLQDEKADKHDFMNEIRRLEDVIESLGTGKPVEVRAASPKGPKISEDDIDKWNKAAALAQKNADLLDKYGKNFDMID